MQDFQAISIFFGLIGVLFVALAYLLINRGVNEINLSFILGVVALAVSSFICMFAFGGFTPEDLKGGLGAIGNIMMFWAPVFFFVSGLLILFGTHILRTISSTASYLLYGIIVIYLLITVIFISGNFTLDRGLLAGATVVAFGLIINIIVYSMVYREIPEQRNNLAFLLIGMGISLIAVIVQVINNEGSMAILPMEFEAIPGFMINLGILIFTLSFTTIPARVILSKGETSSTTV
jgi:hypothetical protein